MAEFTRLWCFLCAVSIALCLPQRGVWTVSYDETHSLHGFAKSVFKDTKISVTILCSNEKEVALNVVWTVRLSPCSQEYDTIEDNEERQRAYLFRPELLQSDAFNYKQIEYLSNTTTILCGGSSTHVNLPDYRLQKPKIVQVVTFEAVNATVVEKKDEKTTKAPIVVTTAAINKQRIRREAANPTSKVPEKVAVVTDKQATLAPPSVHQHYVAQMWSDGYYVFVLQLIPSKTDDKFQADVTVRMSGAYGYISAVEYPLEIFYGVMGLVYIAYGVVWLILLGCNWKDLLRVQFWIEGVILLGMLEKAVFFAEYESISKYGTSVRGAIIFAELVSAMKRSLARMLVIVVSIGFGIVKPRLGQTFHKVLCVGIIYFVLGSVEGCMRALRSASDPSNELMLAAVPLAVLDAVICWWIFSSLVQTTRTLRLRRNIVKLSLYRHFTNTLIFAVLASIAYMVWSITQHKLKSCITDWKELWVDEGFWHLLFSVILLIIMILWRPTVNNQRYAFSPLLDAAEDDIDDDTMMNDAFDGMKMRSKHTSNGSPKQKDRTKSVEDDLKWVEENIPSSLSDKALPSLLDSDEELQNTHFEISKMA